MKSQLFLFLKDFLWFYFIILLWCFPKGAPLAYHYHVINVYKQIVFQFRKNNKCLSFYKFIRKLINIERMEHIIAIKKNKVYKHLYKWEAVKSKLSKSLCTIGH